MFIPLSITVSVFYGPGAQELGYSRTRDQHLDNVQAMKMYAPAWLGIQYSATVIINGS